MQSIDEVSRKNMNKSGIHQFRQKLDGFNLPARETKKHSPSYSREENGK